MEKTIKETCKIIFDDKQKYIELINQADDMFPITFYSHFICGIPNFEMLDDVKIIDFELLDFDKPIPMLFYAFEQGYFHIEEHHFTDDYKNVRKNNDFIKNNLMYMIHNMRLTCAPNVLYSLADEHEKYRHYDMDLDEIFDEEKLDIYFSKVKVNNVEFSRCHLPVIKDFRLSVVTKYNAIKCEILLFE